jgi:hypothetical protein
MDHVNGKFGIGSPQVRRTVAQKSSVAVFVPMPHTRQMPAPRRGFANFIDLMKTDQGLSAYVFIGNWSKL